MSYEKTCWGIVGKKAGKPCVAQRWDKCEIFVTRTEAVAALRELKKNWDLQGVKPVVVEMTITFDL